MPDTNRFPSHAPVSPFGWLSAWERRGLLLLAVVVVLFGGLVELRAAFLRRRLGDLEVFLRAAWAVRAGANIYVVTSSNGFHYHYPPLLAILLTPLADPPAGADRSWTLPYPLSVALWYAVSLFCLAAAVHRLAGALEQTSTDPTVRHQPWGCRRWWALRLGPILACLPAIGASLVRGQVDTLVLLLVSGMIAALLRGRRWQAGLWLAAATSVKVIPALLVLYPLWRRDWRALGGCAIGLTLALAVIPAAVFGPARAWASCQEWTEGVVRPALTRGGDQSRARELTDLPATDSQSLLAIWHNTLHLDRNTRPRQPSDGVRLAHWAVGALLIAILFWAVGGRPCRSGAETTVFLGSLVMLMLLLSPVCHLHYFCLSLPLLMGLQALAWETGPGLGLSPGMKGLVFLNLLANILPRLPGLEVFRDFGLAGHAGLLLWLVGTVVLRKRARPRPATETDRTDIAGVAA